MSSLLPCSNVNILSVAFMSRSPLCSGPHLLVSPSYSRLASLTVKVPGGLSIGIALLPAGEGEGDGTPFQCSCLESPMDGGAWWAAVHGVAKSRTQLSDFTLTFHFPALEKEMATHSGVLA